MGLIAQTVQARDLRDGDEILVSPRGGNTPTAREIVHVEEYRIDGTMEIWFSSRGKYDLADENEEFKLWHSPDESVDRHAEVVVLR